ncbi:MULTISPECIES: PAS domain-containing sensor histidine kinase [unclassified Carboxylicivirga]|uniref:sensor histidine kinase n=1 Tax=Carboxylicivirga TaxID=1628153 RepID=UPI003D32E055
MEIQDELIQALDYTESIVILTDERGVIRYVNKSFEKKYGYTRGEVLGKKPDLLKSGYHTAQFYTDLWNTIQNGETWHGVFKNLSKQGNYIWEKAVISPVLNAQQGVEGYIAVKEDITLQRQLEQQHESDIAFLDELFDNSPIGIAIVQPIYQDGGEVHDFRVVRANPSAGRVVGRLGLVGVTVLDMFPEFEFHEKRILRVLKHPSSFETQIKDIGKHIKFRTFPFGQNNICLFFYDVTPYRQMIKSLATSEQRYFSLLEDAPALISRFDKKGILIYANEAYCQTFEVSREELIGTCIFEWFPEGERDRAINTIRSLTAEQPISVMEQQLILKNGKTKWMRWLDRALLDSKGNIFEYQSVGMDLTPLKQSELQLKAREAKLKELNTTKDKLFSIIAHDIKNPFNSILGFSSLLRDNLESYSRVEIKQFIEQISVSSERVYKLLDDLLVWAMNQLGQMTVTPHYFRLKKLIDDAYESYSIHARNKHISLINEVDGNVVAYADIDMIKFVIRNLIHNAIKFTGPRGEVRCSVRLLDDAVVLSVKDTGIGIRPEKAKMLFDLHSYVSSEGTSSETGTGLGLHLSSDMVEKNGGRIEVRSEHEQGAEFLVTLPLLK